MRDLPDHLETQQTEAAFVRYWRAVWQGVPPPLEYGRVARLNDTAMALAGRDMTRACLDFLLSQGGGRVRRRLVFPDEPSARPQKADCRLGDACSAPLLDFRWSNAVLEWMLHVFQGKSGVPPSLETAGNGGLGVSEGVLVTLLLDHTTPRTEGMAPLARLPAFSPAATLPLLRLTPFAQIFYFDQLADADIAIDLTAVPTPDFLLEAFSVLIPFAVNRWMAIEKDMLQATDPARLERLCRYRGTIARQLSDMAQARNRHDIMEFHARLTARMFANPFYDPNRGLAAGLQRFSDHIGRLLDEGERARGTISFARFYRTQRPPREDESNPVPDHVLDSLPVGSWSERDNLLTACDLWEDSDARRVAGHTENPFRPVLRKHLRESALHDEAAIDVVARHLHRAAGMWLSFRFAEASDRFQRHLEERFERLDPAPRKRFQASFSELSPDFASASGRLFDRVLEWLVIRRTRRWLENSLAQEGGYTRDAHPWRQRHEVERDEETEWLAILNDARHDVAAWLDAWLVRLGDHAAFQSLVSAFRDGYAFAAEWVVLWRWRGTIDRWDERQLMTSDLVARVRESAWYPEEPSDTPVQRFAEMVTMLSMDKDIAGDVPYWAGVREMVEADLQRTAAQGGQP